MTDDEVIGVVDRYRAEPVAFAKEVLGGDPWSTQSEILEALAQPRARVAVAANTGCGKTHTAACAVLWWTNTGGICITTSATWSQVKHQLWTEIRSAHARAVVPLGGTINLTDLTLPDGMFALALSTTEESRFSGFHAKRVLVVIDEGQGVREPVWAACKGLRSAGDVRTLAVGNPITVGGTFRDIFHDDSGWATITIDAFDTPNFARIGCEKDGVTGREFDIATMTDEQMAECTVRPYLTTPAWVKEMYDGGKGLLGPDWGPKVRGRWARSDPQQLIALDLVEAAGKLKPEVAKDAPLWAGVDVGAGGEGETVVYIVAGEGDVVAMGHWSERDPRGSVAAFLLPFKGRLAVVNVDWIGFGASVCGHLGDLGYKVDEVNVGEPAKDKGRFINLRAEAFWALRERFESAQIRGLTDEKTRRQLVTVRLIAPSPRGQMRIEPKDVAAKRGVRSPDRADALMLACLRRPRLEKVLYGLD